MTLSQVIIKTKKYIANYNTFENFKITIDDGKPFSPNTKENIVDKKYAFNYIYNLPNIKYCLTTITFDVKVKSDLETSIKCSFMINGLIHKCETKIGRNSYKELYDFCLVEKKNSNEDFFELIED